MSQSSRREPDLAKRFSIGMVAATEPRLPKVAPPTSRRVATAKLRCSPRARSSPRFLRQTRRRIRAGNHSKCTGWYLPHVHRDSRLLDRRLRRGVRQSRASRSRLRRRLSRWRHRRKNSSATKKEHVLSGIRGQRSPCSTSSKYSDCCCSKRRRAIARRGAFRTHGAKRRQTHLVLELTVFCPGAGYTAPFSLADQPACSSFIVS